MNTYDRALELKEETIANRRTIHENAEVGLELPKTVSFVTEKLKEYGLDPIPCGHGVTAVLGKREGKTLLLRADMDALPIPEESGEPFACKTGTASHSCGHDFHAAMLLTAAKILKEQEASLEGTVKFMFQPAEETFQGCVDMVEAGILENPHVDAALAYHVGPGQMPIGIFMYNNTGTMMHSMDEFELEIHGKGSHGAYPHAGIDPINIGVHIHLALQELIARETDPSHSCVLTVGQFNAGTASNIIPDTAMLRGTLRTNNAGSRDNLLNRIRETAEKVAEVYRGSVDVIIKKGASPLVCNPALTSEMVGYMQEIGIPNLVPYPGISASASEDFSLIADRVPSAFMYLSAGYSDERGQYPAHHSKVRFNEEVCPIGAACLAHCAIQWLKNNK